jgi:DNA topoisomerase-2
MGLVFGKEYTKDVSSLRYGHLMIMTDQDHDGSHIKGLLINFLHHFWPSLLQVRCTPSHTHTHTNTHTHTHSHT